MGSTSRSAPRPRRDVLFGEHFSVDGPARMYALFTCMRTLRRFSSSARPPTAAEPVADVEPVISVPLLTSRCPSPERLPERDEDVALRKRFLARKPLKQGDALLHGSRVRATNQRTSRDPPRSRRRREKLLRPGTDSWPGRISPAGRIRRRVVRFPVEIRQISLGHAARQVFRF